MRRGWFTTGLFIFCVVFLVGGTIYGIRAGWWIDFQNKAQLPKILQSRSALDLRLTITYDKPPIYQEQYVMHNDNGVSGAQYKIVGYSGKVVTITEPPIQTFDVTFFFEKVVQDGIWDLVNKPPRGDTGATYTLYIHQLVNGRQGSRTITFTDPHYWAVTAGHQYQIRLGQNNPSPGLVKLGGTSAADPRFEKIVNDFRSFGPASFREKVAQGQRLVRASK